MKNAVIFGGVVGVVLTICGLHANQWQFWVAIISINSSHVCFPSKDL